MIHTLRNGETKADIAELYKTEEALISNANSFAGKTSELVGGAVYVPGENFVFFGGKDINRETAMYSLDINDVLIRNKFTTESLNDNSMLIYPKYEKRSQLLYAIAKTSIMDEAFVQADKCALFCERVYIDCYDVEGKNLNLPNDYPAINAARLNNCEAFFVLKGIVRYAEDDILKQLKHDLLFKDYTGAILFVENKEEATAAVKIASSLQKEALPCGICSYTAILEECAESFDELFVRTEANRFDFASYAENIDKLLNTCPSDKLGVFYKRSFADINKKLMSIASPTPEMIEKLFSSRHIKEIIFDNASQLCFSFYEEEGVTHNLVFEDMRSFFSKTKYAAQKGIKKVLTDEADLIKLYDSLLKLASPLKV